MTAPDDAPLSATENADQKNDDPTRSVSRPLRTALLLAALGFVLSSVLVFIHLRTHLAPAVDAFCSLGQLFDCASVAASESAIFLGAPWAFWGLLGFGTLFYLSLARSVWLLPLSVLSALTSVALLLLSVLKVGSLCTLCEGVHVITWILCLVVVRERRALQGSLRDVNHASSVLAGPFGLAIAMAIFTPPYWAAYSFRAEPPFPTGVTEDGHAWIGSKTPSLTFEEFTDYHCPHCKAHSASTLRRLKQHPGWRLIRRQQPRMSCPPGVNVACETVRLAFCAQEQGKFWRADRWLFVKIEPGKAVDLKQMSTDLGLDEAKLQTCVTSDDTYRRAQAESKAASLAKIKDVPGYVVDGKRYRLGEFEEFLKKRED